MQDLCYKKSGVRPIAIIPEGDSVTRMSKQAAIVGEDLWQSVQNQLEANKHGTEKPSAKYPSLLAGKLETAAGQKLIPSHAVKLGKRYRYYIEQRLVQDDGVSTKGARYVALEVERAVLTILKQFLTSTAELIAAIGIYGLSPDRMKALLRLAKDLSARLNDHHTAREDR